MRAWPRSWSEPTGAARRLTTGSRPVTGVRRWRSPSASGAAAAHVTRPGPRLARPAARRGLGRSRSASLARPLEWGLGHHERAAPSLRMAVAGYDAREQLLSAWLSRSILCDALFSTGGFDEIERLAEGWDAPALAPLGPLPKGVAWYAAFVRMSRGRAEEAEPLLGRLRGDTALGPLMHHFDRLFTAFADASGGRVDFALDMVADSADQLAQHDPGNHAPFVAATRDHPDGHRQTRGRHGDLGQPREHEHAGRLRVPGQHVPVGARVAVRPGGKPGRGAGRTAARGAAAGQWGQ